MHCIYKGRGKKNITRKQNRMAGDPCVRAGRVGHEREDVGACIFVNACMQDEIGHEGQLRGGREGVRKMVNARTFARICRGRGHGEGGSKSGPDGVGVRSEGMDWGVRGCGLGRTGVRECAGVHGSTGRTMAK